MVQTGVIILAAGQGKRMKSRLNKVLHPLCGEPILSYPLRLARSLAAERVAVVVGHQAEEVKKRFPEEGFCFVHQSAPRGTGDAVRCSAPLFADFRGTVLVLFGDTPLLRPETVVELLQTHRHTGAAVTLLTALLPDPRGYGRIVRDEKGEVLRIVEEADASPAERKIQEINSGISCFDSTFLFPALDRLSPQNQQGEYYLTDLVGMAREEGRMVAARQAADWQEVMGIDDRRKLAQAEHLLRLQIAEQHMLNGVTILDPAHTYIDRAVEIGRDTVIYPNCYLQGETRIGDGCTILPNTFITSSTLEDEVVIKGYSVITESYIGAHSTIGPFAHLRPGSMLAERVKIGNFVEVKKSVIGEGSKASHLSYIGDTLMGKGVNIGAGMITCNYDGKQKAQTIIEDEVFVGSDSQFIAPIRIGRGSYIATGTTVRKDVPPESLVFNRKEEIHREGWARERKKS
ncbi:MAG: bifunctional UDP-N-acetylglucosamine diphosphorylase/glucosamine-1-phosphate N-acetyltransferase GlmU [Nitrospinota bacterium]|nr:MAG: bifunctional UDP-N-acetylglucosamine diphosphorylase/glucosamine-1-phosphate N-acetyltransferase GlmU [Nitrospinota bacterium]